MSDYSAHLQFIVGLFAMIGPFSAVPVMLALTADYTTRQHFVTAATAMVAMLLILVGTQYAGIWLLDLLGTSLGSLEIAGGLVIAISGFAMLSASGLENHPMFGGGGEGASPMQLGVVPMAVPLLAGPGAITKVLLESQDGHGVNDTFHVTLIVVGVCLVVGVVLMLGHFVGKLIGRAGTIIFNRLFGLIVIAIGIEIIGSGVAKHLVGFTN